MCTRAFPEFLRPIFDAEELGRSACSVAALDPKGVILWVNTAWRTFAEENGASPSIHAVASYFDGITQPLRDYYRAAFANALITGDVFEQEYDCSTPDLLRRHHLRALPIRGEGLLVEHSQVFVGKTDAAPADADQAPYLRADGTILQCSNCRRVRRPDSIAEAWDWVPALVAARSRAISHGLCASCAAFYWGGTGRGR